MAVIINTVNDRYFSLNGIEYPKIYQPLRQGNDHIGLYNIYDTRQQLLSSTRYSDFIIDSNVPSSQSNAISTLLDLVLEFKLSSDVLSIIDTKTEKGGFTGTSQDLKNEIEGISTEGIKHYQIKNFLPNAASLPSGTVAKVVNDPDPAKNGYWSVSGGVWVKDPSDNDYDKSSASVHRRNLVEDITLIDDKYVAVSGGGSFNNIAGYSVAGYIPVDEETVYRLNPTVGIYHQFAFYDYNYAFISGRTSRPSNGYFKTPVGAKFAAFSIKDSDTAVYSVHKIADKSKTLVVSLDENTDYPTIQDAIDATPDHPFYPQTIYIKSGTYIEELNTRGKNIRLVGECKYTTVIQMTSGEYANPPLECDTRIYLENLKLKHTNQAPTVPSIRGYAMHLDYTGEGTAWFKDVIFESHQNAGAGIGLHLNQTLIFDNCEFYKYDGGLPPSNGGAFYIHNATIPVANQRLIMRNCYSWSESGAAIRIDDAAMNAGNVDTDTVFMFANNTFWSEQHQTGSGATYFYNPPTDGGFVGRIKLHGASHGNNISDFNA